MLTRSRYMHGVAIDHHEDRILRTHQQALQEDLEDRSGVGAVLQHEAELSLGADGREHFEIVASTTVFHYGRLSRFRPSRARVIVRKDAGLVGNEHRRSLLSGLLLDDEKFLGLPFLHLYGILLPGQVKGFLHLDAQQRHDATDQ